MCLLLFTTLTIFTLGYIYYKNYKLNKNTKRHFCNMAGMDTEIVIELKKDLNEVPHEDEEFRIL